MLSREELKDLDDAVRNLRFLLATSLVALEVDSTNKNCNKKMDKLARLNDKLKAEMLSLDTG